MSEPSTSELAQRIAAGDRRALARAITLVESGRADHRDQALALLETLGRGREALRIGLSGTPGVGKSSFIEVFGMQLIDAGMSVAVLAVDPTSARSGGSILGDKTRMGALARAEGAFVRPSPAGRELGGVARRTAETVALCEAAGFDVVVVETVGVGQSETLVAEMSDLFVLLIAPGGGDELQGVKRGIMEMADLILVNKSDGDLAAAARRTAADYAGALRLLRRRPGDPEGVPKVLQVSALEGAGLSEAWAEMRDLADWRKAEGVWAERRRKQAVWWLREEVRRGLMARFEARGLAAAERNVAEGRQGPGAAAAAVLKDLP